MLNRALVAAASLCLVPSLAFGDTNAANRAAKPIGVALLYTPLSDFVLQYGVGGTYLMNPQLQLGFDFLTGSESLLAGLPEEDGIEFTKADLSGMAFYAYGRYFFGDSFNVKGGVGYRSADVSYRIETPTGDYLAGDLSISGVILPVAIGNHWSWNNGLSVGVDWVTYMIALTGSSEATTESSFSGQDLEIEKLNDDMLELGDGLAHTSTLTLALVSFAYNF